MLDLAAVGLGPVRYNSPWTQITILGFVVFCSAGMFSAASGLGAGGLQDVQLSDTANSLLYACFAVMGLVAGSVNNMLGPRLTLSLGTTGYSLYVGALWAYQVHGTGWFLILSGAILGVSAALLWAAQGSVMMSYPLEKDKGRSFALFWSIFQLGTLTGAGIALAIEADSTLPSLSTAVYMVFMVIMLTAILTSWLLLPPNLIVRDDGTLVELENAISPAQEMKEFVQLFKDWRMLALFPMFFSSNYFYSYQGAITTVLFNARTRALVSLLTGFGSILGSIMIGLVTDILPGSRRQRALCGVGFVLVMTILVWASGLGFQLQFTRADHVVRGHDIPWDWSVGVAAGPIVLLMAYYISDAAYQGLAYYTMSSITNDPFKLARMAGYYKGVQSAGAAVSFGMDAVKTSYLGEILVSWILLLLSLPLCAWVVHHTAETNNEYEAVRPVEDVSAGAVDGGIAVPEGQHVGHAVGPLLQATAAGPQERRIFPVP